MSDLTVKLELEKQTDGQANEMFYRYAIADFKLWFAQNIENGNIYSVGFRQNADVLMDFELNVYANEEKRGGYYPNEFTMRGRSSAMSTDDARKYMRDMEKACAILDKVEEFFKTSKHFAIYSAARGEKTVDVELAARLNDFYKDYDYYDYADKAADFEAGVISDLVMQLYDFKAANGILVALKDIKENGELNEEQANVVEGLIKDVTAFCTEHNKSIDDKIINATERSSVTDNKDARKEDVVKE